jgi:hypothetical protein
MAIINIQDKRVKHAIARCSSLIAANAICKTAMEKKAITISLNQAN